MITNTTSRQSFHHILTTISAQLIVGTNSVPIPSHVHRKHIYFPIFAREREKDYESKASPIGQKFCNEVFHRHNGLSFMYSTCSSEIVNPVLRTFQSSRVTNRLRSDAGLTVLKTIKTCIILYWLTI